MATTTAYIEVVNSTKTRFSNATLSDVVMYPSLPSQSIHFGTNLGSNSAMTVSGSNVTIHGTLQLNGETFTNNTGTGTGSTGITYTSNVFVALQDSADAPGFTWCNDLDTGMYQKAQDSIGFSCGSSNVMSLSPSNISVGTHIQTRSISAQGLLRIGTNNTVFTPIDNTVIGVPYNADKFIAVQDSLEEPGFTWQDDLDTGFFRVAPDSIGVACDSSNILTFTTSNIKANVDMQTRAINAEGIVSRGILRIGAGATEIVSPPQQPLPAQTQPVELLAFSAMWHLSADMTSTTFVNSDAFIIVPAGTYSTSSSIVPSDMWPINTEGIVLPVDGIYTISYGVVTDTVSTITSYISLPTYNVAFAGCTGAYSVSGSHSAYMEAGQVLRLFVNAGGSTVKANDTFVALTLLPQLVPSTLQLTSAVGTWRLSVSGALAGMQSVADYALVAAGTHTTSLFTIDPSMFWLPGLPSHIVLPFDGIYALSYSIVTDMQTTIAAHFEDTVTGARYGVTAITGGYGASGTHTGFFAANTALTWHANSGSALAEANDTLLVVTLVSKIA